MVRSNPLGGGPSAPLREDDESPSEAFSSRAPAPTVAGVTSNNSQTDKGLVIETRALTKRYGDGIVAVDDL